MQTELFESVNLPFHILLFRERREKKNLCTKYYKTCPRNIFINNFLVAGMKKGKSIYRSRDLEIKSSLFIPPLSTRRKNVRFN